MRKVLAVLLITVLSISMFAFTRIPILDENQLIEVKGAIENIKDKPGNRFFTVSLKDEPNFEIVFPRFPELLKWIEKDTDIALKGYYIELKTGKYFVPVKVTYKEKSFDLRKEIARRLYARKKMLYYKQKNRRPYNYNMYPGYSPNMMNRPDYYNPGLPKYPGYSQNTPYTPNTNYYPPRKVPPIK
ncbi:hypothetical protein [Marinitoga aeolica]|uniref:Uncharacterized protein n=1 Tax=Marinitoga aeolica TaxID=2809031 RepID=A0ABY8PQF1_9BACT|nr:hypothetical protein [Marinitoga aeolica]WGS64778.1 hypothetical protein JRV97_10530 [Marinitoga aeolica]